MAGTPDAVPRILRNTAVRQILFEKNLIVEKLNGAARKNVLVVVGVQGVFKDDPLDAVHDAPRIAHHHRVPVRHGLLVPVPRQPNVGDEVEGRDGRSPVRRALGTRQARQERVLHKHAALHAHAAKHLLQALKVSLGVRENLSGEAAPERPNVLAVAQHPLQGAHLLEGEGEAAPVLKRVQVEQAQAVEGVEGGAAAVHLADRVQGLLEVGELDGQEVDLVVKEVVGRQHVLARRQFQAHHERLHLPFGVEDRGALGLREEARHEVHVGLVPVKVAVDRLENLERDPEAVVGPGRPLPRHLQAHKVLGLQRGHAVEEDPLAPEAELVHDVVGDAYFVGPQTRVGDDHAPHRVAAALPKGHLPNHGGLPARPRLEAAVVEGRLLDLLVEEGGLARVLHDLGPARHGQPEHKLEDLLVNERRGHLPVDGIGQHEKVLPRLDPGVPDHPLQLGQHEDVPGRGDGDGHDGVDGQLVVEVEPLAARAVRVVGEGDGCLALGADVAESVALPPGFEHEHQLGGREANGAVVERQQRDAVPIDGHEKRGAMQAYPKRRNGDEYYPKRFTFVVNEYGKEIYARDRRGNQVYPNRDANIFAQDSTGEYYYAKDASGNEHYPVRGNQSLFVVDHANQTIRLALYADGTQRYPSDGKGNEYYFKENRHPFLMRKSTGERYLARSRTGRALIPWNHMQEYVSDEPCVYSRDANGNTVYLKESELPQAFKALIRCICHISVICPNVTGCHTRFY